MRMVVGHLPKQCKWIQQRVAELRRIVEAEVLQRRSVIGAWDAAQIQTICRLEQHAMLAQRYLRKAGDSLSPDAFLKLSGEIAKAAVERDKCLASLGLDKPVATKFPGWPGTTRA